MAKPTKPIKTPVLVKSSSYKKADWDAMVEKINQLQAEIDRLTSIDDSVTAAAEQLRKKQA